MTSDHDRAAAIVACLKLPDPPDIAGLRGYRYTQPRDPRRDPEILKRDLGTAYVERRRHELGKDISEVVSVRRQPRLRVLEWIAQC